MKLLLKLLALVFVTLIVLSCDSNEPQTNSTLSLTVEDVSCTEAWLQLKTTNLSLPNNITLFVNDLEYKNYLINNADTLLYIDSLQPNKNYTFKAVSFCNPEDGVNSNKINTTTLDTTSHNFTWQTFTFGEHSSSTLYDVAIINENDIWAVGEIYMYDSIGNPDPACYNAVHWDGQSWKLKKIKTNACGGVDYPAIKAIFSFSTNDILFAHIDGSLSYYNGIEFTNDCSLITQLNGSANKIWGRSRNNFYVVSRNGFIAHYQNSSWTKIESGIELNFYGILGNEIDNNKYEILCVSSKPSLSTEKKIFKIESNALLEVSNAGIHSSIIGLWFKSGKKYYIVGSGIFSKIDIESNKGWTPVWQGITEYYTNSIDGNSLNDIIICGSFGEVLHYNGSSWLSYKDDPQVESNTYGTVKIKDDLITIVGRSLSKAVITIGRR
ncbi:MAG: glucosyl transferase [Ignavibacteriaceae bacterium]